MLLHCFCYSQTQVGVRGGFTVSTILQTEYFNGTEHKLAIGPVGGITVNSIIKGKVAVQPEILLYSRGVGGKGSFGTVHEKYTLRLFYFDIPVLVKYYFGDQGIRGFIGAGPQLSIGAFTQEKLEIEDAFGSETLKETSEFPEEFKNIDFALPIDIGLRLELDEKKSVEFGIRAAVGIIPLVKDDFNGIRNRNLTFAASVAFLFGGKDSYSPNLPIDRRDF